MSTEEINIFVAKTDLWITQHSTGIKISAIVIFVIIISLFCIGGIDHDD